MVCGASLRSSAMHTSASGSLRGYGVVEEMALDRGAETGVTLGVAHLRPRWLTRIPAGMRSAGFAVPPPGEGEG